MKKHDLTKLAIMGIAGGLLITGQAQADDDKGELDVSTIIAQKGSCAGPGGCAGMKDNGAPKELAERDLWNQLNEEGRNIYETLDAEGRKLALQLANRSCAGHNDCKGLNACASDKNACSGQGGCQGQSKCNFKDKNLAVKVAAKNMEEQRGNMNKPSSFNLRR